MAVACTFNDPQREEVWRTFVLQGTVVQHDPPNAGPRLGRHLLWKFIEDDCVSRLRNELVFTSLARDYRRRVLMVAPYRVVNHAFRPDKPRPWSATVVLLRILAGQKDYALHPDGMRVAIADTGEGDGLGQTHLTFVFNFLEELRRVAPPRR